MADYVPNSTSPSRPNFSMVITEMHQTFSEKNIGGTLDGHSSSWAASDAVCKTASVLTPFSSGSASELHLQTIHTPAYALAPSMPPISAAIIQHALRNLRSVRPPEDFPAVTSRSRICCVSPILSPGTPTTSFSTNPVPSPRFSIGSSVNSINSDDSEILNSSFDVLRSIRRSRNLTRSVAAYLRSVEFGAEPPTEQDYAPTTETQYEFQTTPDKGESYDILEHVEPQPTQEETTRAIIRSPGTTSGARASVQATYSGTRTIPQSSEATTEWFESYSSGDRPRTKPTILEQIINRNKGHISHNTDVRIAVRNQQR